MIGSEELERRIVAYREQCEERGKHPTYNGLAARIGTSTKTVSNVAHGQYNGKPYGDKPHATRCIDNKDFEVVQSVFDERMGKEWNS